MLTPISEKQINKPDKYAFYMRKTIQVMNEKGELPELYYANSQEHNENCPLAWSQALFVVGLKDWDGRFRRKIDKERILKLLKGGIGSLVAVKSLPQIAFAQRRVLFQKKLNIRKLSTIQALNW